MMEVSPAGYKLIRLSEGLRLESYKDEAGHWTIGYGHKRAANYPYTISSIKAESLLREDVRLVEQALNAMLLCKIEQWEFDALSSWVFNIGPSAARTSTLIQKLNFGEPHLEIASEFLRWNKVTLPDGTKIPKKGLTARRERERQLFLTGRI